MADFYMHVLLAEDIVKTSLDKLNLSLVKMGAQGPDPFYFNIFTPYRRASMDLADLMHETKVNEMLISMLTYVKSHYSVDLYSFYVGFLTHYALDTILHPYIYHHAGNYKKNNPLTRLHRGLHVKFERRVDIHFIRFVTHELSYMYPVCDFSFDQSVVPDNVKELMGHVAKEVYHVEQGASLYQSGYPNMQKTCKKLIQDRFGIKKFFLSIVDLFNKTEIIHLRDLSYHNYDQKFDYLNLKHQTWYHPITQEPQSLSVLDLYVRAYCRAQILIKETSSYLHGDATMNLHKLFGNLSLNTGVDVDLDQTMKHFNLFNRKK